MEIFARFTCRLMSPWRPMSFWLPMPLQHAHWVLWRLRDRTGPLFASNLLRPSHVFSSAEIRGVEVLFSPFPTIHLWLFGNTGWIRPESHRFHFPKAHVNCRVSLAGRTTSGLSSSSVAFTMRLLPLWSYARQFRCIPPCPAMLCSPFRFGRCSITGGG